MTKISVHFQAGMDAYDREDYATALKVGQGGCGQHEDQPNEKEKAQRGFVHACPLIHTICFNGNTILRRGEGPFKTSSMWELTTQGAFTWGLSPTRWPSGDRGRSGFYPCLPGGIG